MILSSPLLDCSYSSCPSKPPLFPQGCRIVLLCLSFSRSLTRAGSSPWWIWCVFCATSPPSKRSGCMAFCVLCVLRVRAGLRWMRLRRLSSLLQALPPPRCHRSQVIPTPPSPSRRRRSTRGSAKIAVPSGQPSPSSTSMVGVSPSALRVGIKRIMRMSTSPIFRAGVDSRSRGRGVPSVDGAFVVSRILPMSRRRRRCRSAWLELKKAWVFSVEDPGTHKSRLKSRAIRNVEGGSKEKFFRREGIAQTGLKFSLDL